MTTAPSPQFQSELTKLLPNLRAFARSLTRSGDQADDLVQEALMKAWRNWEQFAPDSNLKAWMFTILRNAYLSEIRKRKNEVQDVDGEFAGQVSVKAEQPGHMDMIDFQAAFAQLLPEHKEALVLIGAEGFSYEEAALMCGCAVGTMKSRVNRARNKLAQIMGLESAAEIGTGEKSDLFVRTAV
ncbi:MAG: RNA polymerase subunit sigma [Hyphomicrobium sp. 32-62-53]|nr:MAG: RNA polymerase subunit sigma [Hyphomicrobium sp. 12-62-95]OYY01489.1 MAG: RNA polymerase subunit sigma [Hyphomicrobium sp. 32-62-53]